jgi:hypothetical protein
MKDIASASPKKASSEGAMAFGHFSREQFLQKKF